MTEQAVVILERAREMVAVGGWVQNTGRSGTRRCAGQALMDAWHEVTGATSLVTSFCGCPMCVSMHGVHGAEQQMMVEATGYFHQAIGTDDIPNWNDRLGRTQGEVLTAFDRAITLAKRMLVTVIEPPAPKVEYKPIVVPQIVVPPPTEQVDGPITAAIKKVLAGV